MKKRILALAGIATLILVSTQCFEKKEYVTYVYTVEEQDTLYGIGKYIAQENEDVREVVRRIKEDNDIQDSLIHPGQQLKVRVERKEE